MKRFISIFFALFISIILIGCDSNKYENFSEVEYVEEYTSEQAFEFFQEAFDNVSKLEGYSIDDEKYIIKSEKKDIHTIITIKYNNKNDEFLYYYNFNSNGALYSLFIVNEAAYTKITDADYNPVNYQEFYNKRITINSYKVYKDFSANEVKAGKDESGNIIIDIEDNNNNKSRYIINSNMYLIYIERYSINNVGSILKNIININLNSPSIRIPYEIKKLINE